jgi:hypothetical protein
MEADRKYLVFLSQKEQAVGHFYNRKYFEPCDSDRILGELDQSGNFIYYLVTPQNPTPDIFGELSGGELIRKSDGLKFRVEPV